MSKKTVIGNSTRGQQVSLVVEIDAVQSTARITRDEYLSAILSGYPGQGTMIESAYSKPPPGVIGSRANGMFLN